MSDRPLRIVTWNVLHGLDLQTGAVDLAAVTAAIADLDVDVIALQEVDRCLPRSGGVDQAAEIGSALGLRPIFAPALLGDPDRRWRKVRDETTGSGFGIALLTRHEVVDHRRVALPGGGDGRRSTVPSPTAPGWDRQPRVCLTARIAVRRRLLTVVTTHLSYLPWRGLRQLGSLLGAVATTDPAVLTGDFNLPAAVVRVATPGWRHVGGGPTHPAGSPRLQLDHILLRGLRVRSVNVTSPGPSDHLPVIADLQLA